MTCFAFASKTPVKPMNVPPRRIAIRRGTPIPIWANEDMSEVVCIGSIDELAELSGTRVDDLHREIVDKVTIPSKKTPGQVLHRIDEVFDCWFESGSMPYA